MKISIISKKGVLDDKLGRLKQDDVVELPDQKAMFYIQRGEAVNYQTKIISDFPSLTVGETKPLSASPAVLVLPEQTPSESESGAKRRTRRGQ